MKQVLLELEGLKMGQAPQLQKDLHPEVATLEQLQWPQVQLEIVFQQGQVFRTELPQGWMPQTPQAVELVEARIS
jgi:hypothetical protein